jgi:hypothetical protein
MSSIVCCNNKFLNVLFDLKKFEAHQLHQFYFIEILLV